AGNALDEAGRRKGGGGIQRKDLARHVHSPVRGEQPERAADPWFRVHRKAEEILPCEGGVGERLPYLLGRRSDVDDVNRLWFEPRSVDHPCTARLVSSSFQDGSSPRPVSRKLLRLDSTAGQPLLIISKILLPSLNSSCVTMRRVCPLAGSSSKLTRDGGSCVLVERLPGVHETPGRITFQNGIV